MDLAKSWFVALVVAVLSYLLLGFVLGAAVSYETLASPVGGFLLLRVPTFVIPALIAFAAGVVHPRPQRDRLGRHTAAVFVVPVATLVVNAVAGTGQRTAIIMLAAMLVGLAGTAAGGLLAHRIRKGRSR